MVLFRTVISTLLLICCCCLQNALAARILALCTVPSPSHSLWCYQYLSLLADQGHQITVLGVDEPKFQIPNLKKFIIRNVYDVLQAELDPSKMVEDPWKVSLVSGFSDWNRISSNIIFNSSALQDLMTQYESDKVPFDLVIFDDACCTSMLGLVHKFGNPPLLLVTTYGSPQWMTFRTGNIFNPAYVPSMISPFHQQMTFYERFQNTFHYLLMEYTYYVELEPLNFDIMKDLFGKDVPSANEIARQSNIIIVNHHFALHDPRPLLPGVIGIAGLHIPETPRPLPQDIKEFLDGAKEGAILLSFGTNVNSNWLPKDIEAIILTALEKLPQRVFWKWDKEISKTPKNVKVSKWLPQGDMLVHPNMRLFVSHCGLLSTQEAIYHKMPILALPVFLDQIDNAAMLVRQNLTIKLNVFELTSDQLTDSILEILSNPKYKKNMEKMGELMRDLPQTAREQAVFWTEYAIRHQGAPHLRAAAADLPWYKLLLLDILTLAIFILITAFWLIKMLLRLLLNVLGGSSKKKND